MISGLIIKLLFLPTAITMDPGFGQGIKSRNSLFTIETAIAVIMVGMLILIAGFGIALYCSLMVENQEIEKQSTEKKTSKYGSRSI